MKRQYHMQLTSYLDTSYRLHRHEHNLLRYLETVNPPVLNFDSYSEEIEPIFQSFHGYGHVRDHVHHHLRDLYLIYFPKTYITGHHLLS